MNFSELFPSGFRVLLVDDDPVSSLVQEKVLHIKCNYKVTTCNNAKMALFLLSENKQDFDVLLCDAHMPEMDGFELLNVVRMELGIPVVMISSDSDFDTVMKGIKHGACDYLIKPARSEELGNLWQHVLRRKKQNGQHQKINNNNASNSKYAHKEKNGKENISEVKDAKVMSKKERLKWTSDLDEKFKNVIDQLGGMEYAKPRKIKELIKVPSLTTGHIASHLQKYRKKLATDGHPDKYQRNQITVYQNFEGTMVKPVNCWAENNTSLLNPGIDSHIMVNCGGNFITPDGMRQISLQNHNNVGTRTKYVNSSDAIWQPMSSLNEIGARNNYPNPGMISAPINFGNIQGFGTKMNTISEQGAENHIGFVGEGICLPTWFATDGIGSSKANLSGFDEDLFAIANTSTEDNHYCSF